MFRTALLIWSGNATAALLSLVRNLIVARAIPVADYGIAATFAIALSVIEMVSALGLQQQIVQASDGDRPRFQAALQGFQVLRGVLSAIALFLLAAPIAAFMKVPEATWAFRLVALVPLLRAFEHFDVHRLSRHMRFWPMILHGTAPVALALLAIWPLLIWYGDYRVMLYSIVLQQLLALAMSHAVAERRYRMVLDREIIARSLAFGWPLLVNNVLLFGVFNGDRLIVGRELGVEALAIFSMGMTLTLTPTLVLAKSVQNLFLPKLSMTRDDVVGFDRYSTLVVQAVLVVGLLMVCGLVLFGPAAIHWLLGEKYMPLLPLIAWFGIMQAIRVFKAGPAIIALAVGETSNTMYANLLRIALLPVAWYFATTTGELMVIVWIAILGEVLGLAMAFALLRFKAGIRLPSLALPHAGAALLLLVCAFEAEAATRGAQLFGTTRAFVMLPLLLAGVALLMPELRAYLGTALRRGAR